MVVGDRASRGSCVVLPKISVVCFLQHIEFNNMSTECGKKNTQGTITVVDKFMVGVSTNGNPPINH